MPDKTFSIESVSLHRQDAATTEYIVVHQPLRRILAFTGLSIDDVIDHPIARNTVYAYYKLHKQVQRVYEIVDLERQWNPLGVSTP